MARQFVTPRLDLSSVELVSTLRGWDASCCVIIIGKEVNHQSQLYALKASLLKAQNVHKIQLSSSLGSSYVGAFRYQLYGRIGVH
jgi:hypothetical protein